jgi:hypothetical protein
MQQRDRAGTVLVFNSEFPFDPGAHFARRSGQRLADPGFEFILLFGRQPATAALVTEARQAFDAVFLIMLVLGPDGVIIDEKNLADRLTTHATIQQKQRVGTTRQTVRHRPIAGQADKVALGFGVEEAGTDHARTGIANGLIRKGNFRVFEESGYNIAAATKIYARRLEEPGGRR